MTVLDTTKLTFGKYRGKTPEEVSNLDPDYVVWMYENVKPKPCSKSLRDACEQDSYDEEELRATDQHFGLDGW